MKKGRLIIILLFTSVTGFGHPVSKVDLRFELTSITARLAGFDEYCQCGIPSYAAEIDSCFAYNKGHPLIDFLRNERMYCGVSFDAISSAAAALEFDGKKFHLSNRFDLENPDDIKITDRRWSPGTLRKYISLLNDFYINSRFRSFFDAHSDMYRLATERMDRILTGVKPEWFESFYGVPFTEPEVYVSLCNGRNNYALSEPAKEGTAGILIGTQADRKGDPAFSRQCFNTIIHELNHIYVNHLASAYEDETQRAVDRIFPFVAEQLAHVNYGKEAILPEWITRIAQLKYIQDNLSENEYLNAVGLDVDAYGFIWQWRTMDFMEYFSLNRDRYPFYSDFIPQLVAFLDFTADQIETVVAETEVHPYVTNVYPAPGSVIDPTRQEIFEVRFTFSEPMNTGASGGTWSGAKLTELEQTVNPASIPAGFVLSEWADEYTLVYRIPSTWIELGEIEGIKLTGSFTQSRKRHNMMEDFTVNYKFK